MLAMAISAWAFVDGCSVSSMITDEDRIPTSRLESEYVIGQEDVLDVVVWRNEDLSTRVPVRPDGMISLPLLNDIQASGVIIQR